MRIPIRDPRSNPPDDSQPPKSQRSWLVYSARRKEDRIPSGINWNLILVLALAIVLSASFWTGVGLVIAHLWK